MNIEELGEEERRYRESAHEEQKTLDSRVLSDPVRVLNPKPAVLVKPDEPVADAVQRMRQEHQGCAVVVADDRVIGIFTERDALTRVLAEPKDIATVKVRDVMTADPTCLTLDDTLGYALHQMSVRSFRHLPIVDDAGQPVGVVTQQEGVKYLVGFFPGEVINQPPRSIAQSPPRHQYGG